MTSISRIVVITFAAGLLIAAAAVILYRRHLDRVVAGEEHGLHTNAAEPSDVIRTVLICILAIWLISCMSNISKMRNELQAMRQQMEQQYSQLSGQLYEMEEKLKAQDSVIGDYDFSFRDLDAESRTIVMQLRVSLKEYGEDTEVSVNCGGDVTALENAGGVFSGNVQLELFRLYEDFPVLTVETGGVKKTQVLDGCPDGYPAEYLLPILVAGDRAQIKYRNGALIVSGGYTVYDDGAKIQGLTVKSSSLVFELDGKTVKEFPLEFTSGAADLDDVSGSYQAQKGQQFDILLKSVTGDDWTVTQRVAYYSWEDGYKVLTYGDMTVTDKNGVILFGVKTG